MPAYDAQDRPIDRRTACATLGAASLAAFGGSAAAQNVRPTAPPGAPGRRPAADRAGFRILTDEELGWTGEKYTLPPLPYPADALDPAIDAQTMQIHHDKHHQGYVNGLNNALEKLRAIRTGQVGADLTDYWARELAFNGAGHFNHSLFWIVMAPPGRGGGGEPRGAIAEQIERDFGGYKNFVQQFGTTAKTVKGSGWGWLAYEPTADQLMIMQGQQQQDGLMTGLIPLLGVDVWEHAYYLKYQNRRGEYVDNFFNVINWEKVNELLDRARGGTA